MNGFEVLTSLLRKIEALMLQTVEIEFKEFSMLIFQCQFEIRTFDLVYIKIIYLRDVISMYTQI